MRKFICWLVLSTCLLPDVEAKSWKILYVGNSLTYVNDLPAIVAGIAKQDSVDITYTSFTFPDYSLEDHWNEGKVEDALETGHYDFMIAQQGPSAMPESQALLRDYAGRFEDVCKKYNTRLVLYMVWPSRTRSFDLNGVINSYTKAAAKVGALLCPAGRAWRIAWNTDAALPLYGPDNFHPSVTGSLLAALTIYTAISGKADLDFVKQAGQSWENEVTASQFLLLKQAALQSIKESN